MMARHIGIVACSAEGAALCYTTFCTEAAARMGRHDHPEVSMHTHPLARYMAGIEAGDWQAVADLMLDSARRLARIGAQLLISPDNTIHQAMPLVQAQSPLPWLHIAEEVMAAARGGGYRRLAILGTKFLMEGPVYRDAAAAAGVEVQVPDAADRVRINRIIFDELVYGRLLSESRDYLGEVMAAMKRRGCDAAVLGCTEIPLLVDAAAAPLPTLDSTRLLARAAMARQRQPELLIVDRTVGGKYENYRTPEQEVPEKPLPYVWESCITMGDQWSYKPHDKYKPVRALVHLLVDVVSKGGNMLLNVGPQPDGELPAEALSRLKEIGDWMAVNAEAIHGTRPIAPYKTGRVCLTRKGQTLYAIYLAEDGRDAPPPEMTLAGVPVPPGSKVTMLGAPAPLGIRQDGAGVKIEIPAPFVRSPPCRHAWVVKITP
jgi:aspartate racemase